MRRLAQWQTWVTIASVLALVLMLTDLALFERNRALQVEVAGRQQQLQRGGQMENLSRDLLNAIATLAARTDDPALRAVLAEHGITPSAPPAPPAGAPGPGR